MQKMSLTTFCQIINSNHYHGKAQLGGYRVTKGNVIVIFFLPLQHFPCKMKIIKIYLEKKGGPIQMRYLHVKNSIKKLFCFKEKKRKTMKVLCSGQCEKKLHQQALILAVQSQIQVKFLVHPPNQIPAKISILLIRQDIFLSSNLDFLVSDISFLGKLFLYTARNIRYNI